MAAKVRVGFVGAGFMGQLAHIRSYALLRDRCELVALAEPRERTAELVAARYGIARVYRDHRELLESEELDGTVAVQRWQSTRWCTRSTSFDISSASATRSSSCTSPGGCSSSRASRASPRRSR